MLMRSVLLQIKPKKCFNLRNSYMFRASLAHHIKTLQCVHFVGLICDKYITMHSVKNVELYILAFVLIICMMNTFQENWYDQH